jgi:hypothetical protein
VSDENVSTPTKRPPRGAYDRMVQGEAPRPATPPALPERPDGGPRIRVEIEIVDARSMRQARRRASKLGATFVVFQSVVISVPSEKQD